MQSATRPGAGGAGERSTEQAAEAEDIVHQMQAVLRDAKELAARVG